MYRSKKSEERKGNRDGRKIGGTEKKKNLKKDDSERRKKMGPKVQRKEKEKNQRKEKVQRVRQSFGGKY